MPKKHWLAAAMALVLAASMVVVPFAYYRSRYEHSRRFRVVAEGVLYRSGQLTAAGLEEVIRRYRIRTVVNLQNEEPDPPLGPGLTESGLLARHGVRYVWLPPDLIERRSVPRQRPAAIDAFLAIMDDPANHPVLLHCRAGLHRTGVLAAVYRMEYEGWTGAQALAELKANGFGHSKAVASNDYIHQYILTFARRPKGNFGPSALPERTWPCQPPARGTAQTLHDPAGPLPAAPPHERLADLPGQPAGPVHRH
jgi:tyrosine-protein phosphatase SIW14